MHILGLIALAVTVLWIGGILWRIDDWSRDWSQNHASISPTATDSELQSPVYSDAPATVADRVNEWVRTQSRWTVESTSESGGTIVMHLIRRTPLFRFTDDIRVRLEAHDAGTQLSAESQSRVGKGDLGQNPRNLKELIAGLREKV